jgi:hypothetical protein
VLRIRSPAHRSKLHPSFLYEEKSTRLPILLCKFFNLAGRRNAQYDISGAEPRRTEERQYVLELDDPHLIRAFFSYRLGLL